MTVAAVQYDSFSVDEWFRLSRLAEKHEAKMRTAYLRAARSGVQLDTLQLRKAVIDIVAEVGVTSAQVYGLVFNSNSSIYVETVDDLVERYAGTVDVPKARDAVRNILPGDLPLDERRRRLNTFGLDIRGAVAVERYRQERGNSRTALQDVERARRAAILERGNLLALTETNRIVNTALEALWMDNQDVSKADVVFYDRSIVDVGNIPKRAVKEIITRRDDRVCKYCFPLEGEVAKIGMEFDTDYGYFQTPPFHPRCRCFMIVRLP